MRPTLPLRLALLIGLAACTKSNGGDDTNGDDTDTDSATNYDPGCITVDGSGGYAHIADAVAVADEGSTIALCAGTWDESVVIDKTVTITGAGVGQTFWNAEVNKPAADVTTGGTLTVSNVEFTSSRAALAEEGGTLVATDVQFTSEEYAIEGQGGSVTLKDSLVLGPTAGGVWMQGGALDMENTIVQPGGTEEEPAYVVGFGVKLEGDATATLTGNTITGVVFTGYPDNQAPDDGWGLWVSDGSTATTSGNVVADNLLGNVDVDAGGSLTMDGDTLTGSYYGLWIDAGAVTASNATIDGWLQYGVVAQGTDPLVLNDVTISTDPAASAVQTDPSDFSGSYGIIDLGPDLQMTGGSVSGANGAGIYQAPGTSGTVALTLDGTTLDNNARFGVVTFQGTMDLTDVTVTNTRDDDATCYDDQGYIVCNMAVSAWQSDITWAGGELSGNGTFGLSPIFGQTDVSGVTFRANQGYGIWVYNASFNGDNLTFDQGKQYAFSMQSSSGVLTNSTFENGDYTSTYDWDDGSGNIYTSINYYQAYDAWIYDSSLTVTNTTFSNGQQGLTAYSSDVEIDDSTFDGYNSEPIYGYDSTVSLLRTKFTNTGNDVFSCYDATIKAVKVEIDGVTDYKYKYESYLNGELQWSSESTSPGTGVYGYACDYQFSDMTITNVKGAGMSLYDMTLELDGVTMSNVNTDGYDWNAALYLTYSSVAPNAYLNAIDITGVPHGYGLYVVGSSSYPGGYAELDDIRIGQTNTDGASGVGSIGLYLSTIDSLLVQGVDIANTGSDGIYTNTVTGSISGAYGSRTGTISNAGEYGLYAYQSNLAVTGLQVTSSASAGIYIDGGEHTVDGNTVTGAGTYGIQCVDAPVLDSCAGNSLDGTLGADLDCGCEGM